MGVKSLLVQQRLYYQKKRKMMKKVSCKMFFTVLWKGVCQAVKWFFGLFGYKRDGKFAKGVGRVCCQCSNHYGTFGRCWDLWFV